MAITKIPYSKELKVVNMEALPPGMGCKFLVALIPMEAGATHYIAKQWHRKMPTARKVWSWEVVITF